MIIFYADNYLDRHPEVALQLENNPGLIDDLNYVKNHPGLHWFMQKYPVARQEWNSRLYRYLNSGKSLADKSTNQ